MKKAILLLLACCAYNFAFTQNQHFSNHSTSSSIPHSKDISAAFSKFENAVFVQSDVKNIIASYIELAKKHRDLGHSAEAVSFYERAYVLAKEHYRSVPQKKNPVLQIKKAYQSMLALSRLDGPLFGNSKEDNAGRVLALHYLQQSEQARMSNGHLENSTNQNSAGLSEEKVVASFFFAATEPVKEHRIVVSDLGIYALTKETSLRQRATHRSKSMKRLTPGKELRVLEKTDRHWWKVEVDGLVGYAKALLLRG